jgi:SAM-dependent methyltransferase
MSRSPITDTLDPGRPSDARAPDTTPGACPDTGFHRQFGHPSGRLGAWVGRLMALKNVRMNRAAVEVLAPSVRDRVLEIGFGPGRTLALLARRVDGGRVAGIDVSAVMVRQARRRNRSALRAGRLEIVEGSVERLPWPDATFTHVLAVNSFHHWPAPVRSLTEVRRVLAPGGRLVLGMRVALATPRRLASPGLTPAEIESTRRLLEEAGFQDVALELRSVGRGLACLVARR